MSESGKTNKKIDLNDVFLTISEPMKAILSSTSTSVVHPRTKGDASEYQWLTWLKTYLPKRYEVTSGFVIDSASYISEQQDIIIYDRQYTPYLLNRDGIIYIPAESIYAIIEVKQKLGKRYLKYASDKIRSVRQLARKTTCVRTIDGVKKPTALFRIIGGFVCLKSGWVDGINSKNLKKVLKEIDADGRIDVGCCLESGSFIVEYDEDSLTIKRSDNRGALTFFFIKLISWLQRLGTAPPIDFESYTKNLTSFEQTS